MYYSEIEIIFENSVDRALQVDTNVFLRCQHCMTNGSVSAIFIRTHNISLSGYRDGNVVPTRP